MERKDTVPTRSQIDKLGERLRTGHLPSDDDLEMLEQYQESLLSLLENAMSELLHAFQTLLPAEEFEPTARTKQLRSIVAKLQRERTRLSSMQDLMGVRVVVPGAIEQEVVVAHFVGREAWRVMDRRKEPKYGRGDPVAHDVLQRFSDLIADIEGLELQAPIGRRQEVEQLRGQLIDILAVMMQSLGGEEET